MTTADVTDTSSNRDEKDDTTSVEVKLTARVDLCHLKVAGNNGAVAAVRGRDDVAVDAQWGYLIIAGSFFTYFLVGITFILFSMIYTDLVEHFEVDSAVVGWVGSLYMATGNCVGVVFSELVHRRGCRWVAIVGAVTWAAGFCLSSLQARSVYVLYLTYGVVGGCGLNMAFMTSAVVVQEYFTRHRALASAVTASGLSAGTLVCGPLTRYLLDLYGWQGTLLIVSGLQLNAVVCGALYRPPANSHVTKTGSEQYKDKINRDNSHNTTTTTTSKTSVDDTATKKRNACPDFIRNVFDLTLFRDKNFTKFCLGTFAFQFGALTFYQHLPSRALHLGVSRSHVALIPTYFGLSTLVSRLVFGLVAQRLGGGGRRVVQYSVSALVAGVMNVSTALYTNYTAVSVYAAVQGAVLGCNLTVMSTVLVDIVSVSRAARAHGLLFMFVGAAALLSVPFAGFLFDVTGNYDIPFYVNGGLQALGGVCLLSIRRGPRDAGRGDQEAC